MSVIAPPRDLQLGGEPGQPTGGGSLSKVVTVLAVGLAGEPLRLAPDRVLEAERLGLQPPLVVVVRPGPLDRVPQQDDQPGVGERGRDAGWCQGVEHVIGAGLAGDPAPGGQREARPVPPPASPVADVEVVRPLPAQAGTYLRVRGQVPVQGAGSRPLRPDNQEGGQHASVAAGTLQDSQASVDPPIQGPLRHAPSRARLGARRPRATSSRPGRRVG